MDLVGAWLRQLLRAGTAAAIVPVALLAALLVIAVGSGGLGGLDSLGQLVAGPAVPQMDAAGPSATENVRAAPVAPGGRDVAVAGEIASTRPSTGAPSPTQVRRAPQQRPGRRVAPDSGTSRETAPRPARPAAPPLAPAAPPPPPAAGQTGPAQPTDPLTTTVNGVVKGVQDLIGGLGQALQGKQPPPR